MTLTSDTPNTPVSTYHHVPRVRFEAHVCVRSTACVDFIMKQNCLVICVFPVVSVYLCHDITCKHVRRACIVNRCVVHHVICLYAMDKDAVVKNHNCGFVILLINANKKKKV